MQAVVRIAAVISRTVKVIASGPKVVSTIVETITGRPGAIASKLETIYKRMADIAIFRASVNQNQGIIADGK